MLSFPCLNINSHVDILYCMADLPTHYFYKDSELAKYSIKSSSGKKDEWILTHYNHINIITVKFGIYQLLAMPLEVFSNRDSLW